MFDINIQIYSPNKRPNERKNIVNLVNVNLPIQKQFVSVALIFKLETELEQRNIFQTVQLH